MAGLSLSRSLSRCLAPSLPPLLRRSRARSRALAPPSDRAWGRQCILAAQFDEQGGGALGRKQGRRRRRRRRARVWTGPWGHLGRNGRPSEGSGGALGTDPEEGRNPHAVCRGDPRPSRSASPHQEVQRALRCPRALPARDEVRGAQVAPATSSTTTQRRRLCATASKGVRGTMAGAACAGRFQRARCTGWS